MGTAKEEPAGQFMELQPNWGNTLRWFAQAFMMHDFEVGKAKPIVSFIEQVRYLYHTDPKELEKILDEYRQLPDRE